VTRSRLLIVAAAVLGAVLPTATPAHAATRRPVTMTFTASPAAVEVDSDVALSGWAGVGRTGNASTVDLLFAAAGSGTYHPVGATKAGADGAFSFVVRVSAPGVFLARYRGNQIRRAVSRTAGLTVFRTRRETRTLVQLTGSGAGPHVTPAFTSATGSFRVTADLQLSCAEFTVRYPPGFRPPNLPTLYLRYTDRADHTATGGGWASSSYGIGPRDFGATTTLRSGHLVVEARFPLHCWKVTVTETVATRIPVQTVR
jgi:hypothetical protein